MKTKTIVVAALVVLAFHPSTAFADQIPAEFKDRGCRFYALENGQGNSAKINVNHMVDSGRYEIIAMTMSGYWNDNVSAVQCDRHCSTVLYQDWKRQGAELETIDGQSGFFSLSGRNSNNQTSSAGIFCAR